MKVLSIKEPWASLIVNEYKNYEFRTWKTNYRGKIHIHASASYKKEDLKRFDDYNLQIHPGYIIGEANITDCVWIDWKFHKKLLKIDKEVYKNSVNCYAFVLSEIKKYDKIIPVKGKLGLWDFKEK